MNAQTTQMDDLHLVALPSAVNCAELFVRFALAEWSLRLLLDEAVQVARQVVVAAVNSADPQSPGLITVRLRLRGDRLVIEVEDRQMVSPPVGLPTLASGRTGVTSLEGRGTLVWCELPLPAGVTASAVPLPRREQRRSPAAQQMTDEPAEVDPQVIQRILFGLSQSSDGQTE